MPEGELSQIDGDFLIGCEFEAWGFNVLFAVGGAGQCGAHILGLFDAVFYTAGNMGFDDAEGIVLKLIFNLADNALNALLGHDVPSGHLSSSLFFELL